MICKCLFDNIITINEYHCSKTWYVLLFTGWRSTFQDYYTTRTKETLNLMVSYLSKNPKWRFIWTEVSFLKKWIEENPSKKDQLKR